MNSPETKTCTDCGEVKPLDAFAVDGRFRDGHKAVCIICKHTPSGEENGPHLECSNCGQSKPTSYFHKRSARARGYKHNCKRCEKEIARERKRRHLGEHGKPEEKKCQECEKILDASSFSNDSRSKDGLANRCKTCQSGYYKEWRKGKEQEISERHREWRQDNEEYCRRKRREYYHNNLEEIKAKRQKWKAKNPGEYKRRKRRHYLRNREEILQRNRERYQKNKERYRACMRKRKSRKKGASGNHNRSEIVAQWHKQRGCCFWCESSCGESPQDLEAYHVDHVWPLSRHAEGATNYARNLVISCPSCNMSKGGKWPIEFKRYRLVMGAEKTYSRGVAVELP